MKTILLTISLFAITQINAQQALTKVNNIDENVEHISTISDATFTYATETEHITFNINTYNTLTHSNSADGYTDIDGQYSATGDTLCVSNGYYGMADGSIKHYVDANTTDLIYQTASDSVKYLAYDKTNKRLFTILKINNINNRYILVIHYTTGDSLKLFACSNPISGLLNTGFNSLTYLEKNGQQYILVNGIPSSAFNPNTKQFFINVTSLDALAEDVNTSTTPITTSIFYIGYTDNVKEIAFDRFNEELYYTVGSDIYTLNIDNIDNYTAFNNNTISYTVPLTAAINDLVIGQDYQDFAIYVATDDGVYTNIESLNVEEEESFENVNVYPNPNNGNFHIVNLPQGSTIQVLDCNGKTILKQQSINNNQPIEINIENGIYFIQISTATSVKMLKFIKA